MGPAKLTIILPGLGQLLSQQINDDVIPTTIKKIIHRGQNKDNSQGLERRLFNYFSSEPIQGEDLPILSLNKFPSKSVRIDFCHLRPDRDRLIIFGPENLQVTVEEQRALINEIKPLLTEFSVDCLQTAGDDYVLQLKETAEVSFTALPDISGSSVDNYLPKGKQQRDWIRFWNEIQMVLHDSPVNEQRTGQGLLPINSVWFWGMGEFIAATNRWQTVTGQFQLLQQLSESVDVDVKPLPIDYQTWLDSRGKGQHLLLLDKLDLEGDWLAQLKKMEPLFSLIWDKLRWHKISSLLLDLPNYKRYDLRTSSIWKLI